MSYLDQLDDYSLMNIFDFLYDNDVIAIAEISPRFADIILKHYIIGTLRLHEKPIDLLLGAACPNLMYIDTTNQKAVLTQDPNKIISALKLFGHIFSHITFDVLAFGNSDTQKFVKHVDCYCKNATKRVIINSVDEKALANWTYSFDHTATEVIVRTDLEKPIQYKKLFPFMQRLAAVNLLNQNIEHYPHLTNYSIQSTLNHDNVQQFLRLNPQIQHLQIAVRNNVSHVRYLAELLPFLESISLNVEIVSPNIDPAVIHFKTVKEFTLTISNIDETPVFRNVIGSVQFDQLEMFHLRVFYATSADDQIIEMISKNAGLKRFETNLRMTNETFNGFLQALPELKEISIDWVDEMSNSLETFFVQNHGLTKINFKHFYLRSEAVFMEKIPLNWHKIPSENSSDGSFSLVRSN